MRKPSLDTESHQPLQIDSVNIKTLRQFLEVIRGMPDQDIAAKFTSYQWENWDIIQARGLAEKVTKLKAAAATGVLSGGGLKRSLLGVFLAPDLVFDQVRAMPALAGWRFALRALLASGFLLASLLTGNSVFSVVTVLIACVVLSGYVLGAVQVFTIERKTGKSAFDGLKFAVDILIGISGAMLALIAGRGMLVSVAAASLGISIFVGIISTFNIAVCVSDEDPNYVWINAATWDWIETLITLQFAFFVLGSVSLVCNVVYN
jgi:hypothetical protein